MIEMRWVPITDESTKSGSAYKESVSIVNGYGTYFVLQYRYQTGEDYIGPSWSEWIDVPTVTE